MVKRLYSHYTYIYPNIYLKNVIVELDNKNCIKHIFPFEKEIANTEFYSGLLLFLPKEMGVENCIEKVFDLKKDRFLEILINWDNKTSISYKIFDENKNGID